MRVCVSKVQVQLLLSDSNGSLNAEVVSGSRGVDGDLNGPGAAYCRLILCRFSHLCHALAEGLQAGMRHVRFAGVAPDLQVRVAYREVVVRRL